MIVEAIYGDLSGKRTAKRIQVTVPLQCMVENSCLIVHEGLSPPSHLSLFLSVSANVLKCKTHQTGRSKAWLEGFYDPSPPREKELYVR